MVNRRNTVVFRGSNISPQRRYWTQGDGLKPVLKADSEGDIRPRRQQIGFHVIHVYVN